MPPSSHEKDAVSMANVNSNDDDDDASVPQEEPPMGGDDAQSHDAACQRPMVPSPITTHPIVAAEEEELAEENLRSSTPSSKQGELLPPERVESDPLAAADAISTQAHSSRPNLICAERQKDGEILLDKGDDAVTFPVKLYAILADPDNHHAISWQPHGRSWKVHKRDIFMKEVCPKYFSQTKFESFVRQSNGWGFRRLKRDGPDRNSYYHELFLRGQPELLKSIRRPLPGEKKVECEEPDFYSMSPVQEEDQDQEEDQVDQEEDQVDQEEDQDLPTHVRLETTSNNENKKKRKKGSPEPERNTHGSSFYDGCMSYDPHRYGNMPPPPPPVWSGPPAYQYPPEYYGYGLPAPFPFDSAGCPTSPAGGEQQVTYPSQPCTEMDNSMSSGPSDIPPFDPSLYFPPPYYPLYPPPPPPKGPQALPSQDEDDFHGLMPMPYYPPYPPPYYPPPDGILSTSRGFEDNPTGFRYEFGSIPPYPLPPLRADIAESSDHESNEQRDGLKFSPIQRPDES